MYSAPVTAAPSAASGSEEEADEEIVQSEPTAIQKADLLITQQWLRLIVWQSSFRQSLLSWTASHESMHFAFPLAIARSTANVLRSLPSSAVEVHGMGIFEKIFEIGTWCMNVLGAIDRASATGTPISGIRGTMGMDFVGTGDLGVLGVSRKGVAIDPLEFFVRTLSATPNSRTQFAERLLMFAQERPGGMRMALTPSLNSPVLLPQHVVWPGCGMHEPGGGGASHGGDVQMGGVLGEVVKDENNNEVDADDANNAWSMGDGLGLSGPASASVPSLLGDPILDIHNANAHHHAFTTHAARTGSVSGSGSGGNGSGAAPTLTPRGHHHHQRPSLPTSLSMPALNTGGTGLSSWASGGEPMSATTQDWAYDLTSPTALEPGSAASASNYSNAVSSSAYSSVAGTPVGGQFTPGLFPRQDSSGSSSIFQYHQERQAAPPSFNGFNAGSNNNNGIGMTNE